jgi:type II secretory pathway component PulK
MKPGGRKWRGRASGTAPQRGSVLVLVLVLVAVAALAITRFTERALGEMAGEAYYVQRDRLRGEALSALEVALAVIHEFREIDGGLFAPAQGWGDPLRYAGYEVPEGLQITVRFVDENGRLSLREAESQEAYFLNLFADMGFTTDEVAVLTDSLLDWIDPDDTARPFGAETADYLLQDPPHVAANRPLRSYEELAAVMGFASLFFTETGFPNDRLAHFRARTSLFGTGPINLNTASDDVLRTLGLFDEAQLAAIARALTGPDGERGTVGGNYFRSVRELADAAGVPVVGTVLGVQIRTLSITVTVREGDVAYRLRATVSLDGQTAATLAANTAPGRGATPMNPLAGAPAAAGAVEYPFSLLELVEGPPPTSVLPTDPLL